MKLACAGVSNFTSRPNDQIRYETPNLSGFTAGVTYALDEVANVKNDTIAFNLRYRAGKLDVGVGFQEEKNATATLDHEFTVLSAGYDFGVVRVSGQVHNAKQRSGLKDNDHAIGVAMPLAAFTLSAGYASSTNKPTASKRPTARHFPFTTPTPCQRAPSLWRLP